MLKYKFDVMEKLKIAGYSSYKLRKDKLISEDTKRYMRAGIVRGCDNLNTLCSLLKCQPGDLLEYTPDTEK